MSVKRGRRAKVIPAKSADHKEATSLANFISADMSDIGKASFMEGLQGNDGNPLHSTALEEDLADVEEGRAGKENIPKKLKPAAKQRKAPVKRKETEKDGEKEKEEQQQKKKKRSTGGQVKARPVINQEVKDSKRKSVSSGGETSDPQPQEEPDSDSGRQRRKRLLSSEDDADDVEDMSWKPSPKKNNVYSFGKTRKSSSTMSKTRKSSSTMSKTRKSLTDRSKTRKSSSDGSKSRKSSSDGSKTRKSSSDGSKTRKSSSTMSKTRKSLTDRSKTRKSSSDGSKSRKSSSDGSKSRKSSSGSASSEPEKTNRVERKKKGRHGDSQLEVVLDAFLDFCDQYRESVESKAVKQCVELFSDSVSEQLVEKISSQKELRVLKRKNTKLDSLIRKKTQRLFDAKHELIRAERQASLLNKEKSDLELRLADLKRSNAFLHDVRELNRQYLSYRHTHPKKKETYGVSSLPALLVEAKHIQGAEDHLKGINDRLEKMLNKNGK